MKIFWIYGRVDATRTISETGKTSFVSAEHGGEHTDKGGASPAKATR